MKMLRGASPKRQREFLKLERQFKKEHRYPNREKEVAARIVNKQRKLFGETKDAKEKDNYPDNNLPIKNYHKLTIPQIVNRLNSLSDGEIRSIRTYELNNKNRHGVIVRLNLELHS